MAGWDGNTRKLLTAGLAELFADPWIPAFMRDADAVLASAARWAAFRDPDPSRCGAALAAASTLHPELRVPGALLYLGRYGAYLPEPSGKGYVPAPACMAWPSWFCAGKPENGGFALGEVLNDFAWRAAEALLPPRAVDHAASLAAVSVLPGLAAPKAVDPASFSESEFMRPAALGAGLFSGSKPWSWWGAGELDAAKREDSLGKIGGLAVSKLSARFGEENARWVAAAAEGDLSAGFDERLAADVAADLTDPWKASSVAACLAHHVVDKAAESSGTKSGERYAAPWALHELGLARSAAMLTAAEAWSKPAPDLPEWLLAPNPYRFEPEFANARWVAEGTGAGIAPMMRELSVPDRDRSRRPVPSGKDENGYPVPDFAYWRYAGAWRAAEAAAGPGKAELAFGGCCAALRRADFLAEWYADCAKLPGRLFVAALARRFASWARDGRLFAAAFSAAYRRPKHRWDDPVGVVGRLFSNEGGVLRDSSFGVKSEQAGKAVRLAGLIGSGSAIFTGQEPREWDARYGIFLDAPWDPEIDGGMGELAAAEASVEKAAVLAAEAMAVRSKAFAGYAPHPEGVEGGVAGVLSADRRWDPDPLAVAKLAGEARALLGDEAAGFSGWLKVIAEDVGRPEWLRGKYSESKPFSELAQKAPEGVNATEWALGTVIEKASRAKARRAANVAAALGPEGRRMALSAHEKAT